MTSLRAAVTPPTEQLQPTEVVCALPGQGLRSLKTE
jgi:hypothetical protein